MWKEKSQCATTLNPKDFQKATTYTYYRPPSSCEVVGPFGFKGCWSILRALKLFNEISKRLTIKLKSIKWILKAINNFKIKAEI